MKVIYQVKVKGVIGSESYNEEVVTVVPQVALGVILKSCNPNSDIRFRMWDFEGQCISKLDNVSNMVQKYSQALNKQKDEVIQQYILRAN